MPAVRTSGIKPAARYTHTQTALMRPDSNCWRLSARVATFLVVFPALLAWQPSAGARGWEAGLRRRMDGGKHGFH
jgi:hypothetical protein